MKRNMIMLLAAALFVVTGCKKDNNNNNNGEKMVFNAGFDNGGAKTEINGFEMSWTAGDVVLINGGEFTAKSSASSTQLVGSPVEKDGDLYKAYYPTSLISEGGLILPATQTYDGNKLKSVNPMYTQSTETTLNFHNICALVRIDLTGSGSVKSIEVKANEPLSGAFTIAGNATDGFYAQLTSKEAATVTLDCGNGVTLSGTAQPFYIALPQGTYTNLTFTVNDTKVVRTVDEKALVAGNLYTLTAEYAEPLFSVSPTRKVRFSKGNLYWDGSSFWFEKIQSDFRTWPGKGSYIDGNYSTNSGTPEGHYGLFFFQNIERMANSYTQVYDGTGASANDVLFTNDPSDPTKPNQNFHVNGETGVNAWRVLSKDELYYLLFSRNGNRFSKAKVNNVQGLIIFPDDYSGLIPQDTKGIRTPNSVGVNYPSINMLSEDWAAMETAGVVFLPHAGYFDAHPEDGKPRIHDVGSFATYRSSSSNGSDGAYSLDLFSGLSQGNTQIYGFGREYARSIRMVRDANASQE